MPIHRQIMVGLIGTIPFLLQMARFSAAEITHEIYTSIEMPIHEEILYGDVISYVISTYAVSDDNPESRHLLSEEVWLKPEGENARLLPFATFESRTPNVVYDRTTFFTPVGSRYLLARENGVFKPEGLSSDLLVPHFSNSYLLVLNDFGRVSEVLGLETFGFPAEDLAPIHIFEYNDQGECCNFKTFNGNHVFAESNMEYENGHLVLIKTDGYYGPTKTEITYDDHGHFATHAIHDSLDSDSPARIARYSIERDEQGNCIRRERYLEGQLQYVEEREITYAGEPLPEKVVRFREMLDQKPELEAETPVPVMPPDVLQTPLIERRQEEQPTSPSEYPITNKNTYSLYGSVERLVQTQWRFPETTTT